MGAPRPGGSMGMPLPVGNTAQLGSLDGLGEELELGVGEGRAAAAAVKPPQQ